MTQREIDHIRAKDRWLKVIEQQQESGLSVYAFCKENSIPISRFNYWKRVVTAEVMSDAKIAGVLNTPTLEDGANVVLEAMQTAVQRRRHEQCNRVKERAVEIMLDSVVKTPAGDFVAVTTVQIAKLLGETVANTKRIIRWMREKQLISYEQPGKHSWKVHVTRAEYDSIKVAAVCHKSYCSGAAY